MTDGQQKFLTEPQPQLVRSGSKVKLKCVIANFGAQSQCRWQKDFKPVGLFSGKYSIDRDSQMTGEISEFYSNKDHPKIQNHKNQNPTFFSQGE